MIVHDMQKTKQVKAARAYVAAMPGVSREKQIELCRAAAKTVGIAPNLVKIYGPNEWSIFVGDLRNDEVAVVPDLIIINEKPAPAGRRLGVTFERKVRELERASLYVLDATGGVNGKATLLSTADEWIDHVARKHGSVTHGRKLESAKASTMAKRKKELAPGIATSFNSPARAKELKRVRVLWQSAEFDNAQQAIEAIGVEFPELAGMSRSTAERVTGVGRTNRSKKRVVRNQT